jgi:protein NrfD
MNQVVYNTPHLVHWDWRIAVDLFCGGTGVGAFLTAAVISLVGKDRYPRLSKVGAVLSPLLVIVGLSFLLTEMGHPFRLHYTLTRFNAASAFSWGGPLQGLFISIGLVYAYLWLKPGPASLRNKVAAVGIPVALLLGGYHGGLLAVVTARPLWNTGAAVMAALTGVATTGMAAVLLVGYAAVAFTGDNRSREPQASGRGPVGVTRWFLIALVAALAAHAVALLLWWLNLHFGSAAAGSALAAAGAQMGSLFWGAGVGLGIAAPAVLLLLILKSKAAASPGAGVPLGALSAALILAGGFVFRYAVVIGGQLS